MRWAAVGAAAAFLPACRGDEDRGFATGDRFPAITLPDLDGGTTTLAAYPDAALVINFWATWCGPCRHEMPSLEKLSALFHPKDLLVVGIAVDSDRNLPREFRLRHQLTFPMLSDSDQMLSSDTLRAPAFPITYLLKRDRTIARIIVGAREWAEPKMVSEIEALLAVKRASAPESGPEGAGPTFTKGVLPG
ncbi:MAG: thiol-disulfide isomerase-like protein [Gallionellaceae bacterium]|nr:MAG: thiol-disulfide isomerase-like protein [Gallionellaceae bacterium]